MEEVAKEEEDNRENQEDEAMEAWSQAETQM